MPFTPFNRQLLNAVTATGASAWIELWPYEDVAVHFHGIVAGDIVQVEVSNETGDPTNEVQLGTDITTDDFVVLIEAPRKMRVNVTNISGGGPITVDVSARIPG